MALSVIGAGFGRTGTMSLKQALEQLGFGPCFHMAEFFTNENGEALTGKWARAVLGSEAPDWDEVFAGYQSTVDWPSTAYWRELVARYPAAKVILSVRDADRWFDSTQETIFRGRSSDESLANRTDDWARMVYKAINQDTFGGNTTDRAHCIAVYEAHNEAVKRTIPADRLLVYQASEEWEPLCRFLGVPVPDAPFPRANTSDEFKARRAAEGEAAAKAAEAGTG
jgi:Sulfotransferase domain